MSGKEQALNSLISAGSLTVRYTQQRQYIYQQDCDSQKHHTETMNREKVMITQLKGQILRPFAYEVCLFPIPV